MLVQKVAPTQTDFDTILNLVDAKAFMRIVSSDDDTLINQLIQSAITEASDRTNLNLANATFELYIERFSSDIRLPKNPIKSIQKIEYMDMDGEYQVLASANYYLYVKNGVGYVHLDYYPTVPCHKLAIKITFNSGFDAVPSDIVSWLKVRVSTLYEYREDITYGTVAKLNHVDGVLARYKVIEL